MDLSNKESRKMILATANDGATWMQQLSLAGFDREQLELLVQRMPGGEANVEDAYPLSPLQEGMLFHHVQSEGHDRYILSNLLQLDSHTTLLALIEALQSVIASHSILRTAIFWEHVPWPVQVVLRHAPMAVNEIVLSRDGNSIDHAKEWMTRQQTWDLRHAPLLRLTVAASTQGLQWYALLQVHHLICDHESLKALIAKTVACIVGEVQGPPDISTYRDYVAYALERVRTSDAEDFFRKKLGDIDAPSAPFGLLNVYGDGSDVQEARLALDSGLERRVRVQALRVGASPARLFHVAWGLVVACTTGRDDVVFGTVLSAVERGSARSGGSLGMFVNTLPLRLRLRDASAAEVVQQAQQELTELFGYNQTPLAVAQRCSAVSGAAPLFSTLLNYRRSLPNARSEWTAADGIRLLATGEAWTNYPVTMLVDDVGDGFVMTAQTARQIDPSRMAEYLHASMRSLVDALEQAPHTPALALSPLSDSERHRVTEVFNAAEVLSPQTKLLHELFEAQVIRAPNAVAVVFGEESLTYLELNMRAGQLALHLANEGVAADELVGIYMERGLEMVVAILGVLKAGGAYLPLDPNSPIERLAFMLEDAAPRVLLTQERLIVGLPSTLARVICLDRDWSEIAKRPSSAFVPRPGQSHQLAYVIYTSGSTGQPKGVMVEHGNVTRLFSSTAPWFGFDDQDVWTLFHSIAFDFSVWELWGALLYGGRVIIVPYAVARSPLQFYRLLCEEGVTVLNQTPTAFAQLNEAQTQVVTQPTSLRLVIFGGEKLELHLLRSWIERNGAVSPQLVNMYGITETTVHVTYAPLTEQLILSERGSVVGRPIPDLRVYILDEFQHPRPIGVAGEIYVGGAGLARGYLKRTALTAERFLRDPFVTDPAARMYRSGDLGSWRADGTIEYFGRNDKQVKIRGFRIELGEIETQLAQHAEVREAVVLAREDIPGEKRLVAYVVSENKHRRPDAGELRTHLAAALPDYMVPNAFVLLEQLPLTINGKLDWRKLPPPELEAYGRREYEAPQGKVEELLADIWKAILRVESVGRSDNFFELGGHSLLVMQMMERLRRVKLSADVRQIFDNPTLSRLASLLTSEAKPQFVVPPSRIPAACASISPQMLPLIDLDASQIERIVQRVPGGAANIQDIYPLAPLQEGILFHHLLSDLGKDIYSVARILSVASRDKLEELIAALQAVIDRHDILRTAILWKELPRPVQVVYREATLKVEEMRLTGRCDPIAQIKEWVSQDGQWLDLQSAPLMQLQIAPDAQGGRWYAQLKSHHIVGDYTSQATFMAEVVAHLEGRADLLCDSLPYRNHVAFLLEYADRHDVEAFFRGKLGDIDESTAPFGLIDVRGDGSQIDSAHQMLDPELAQEVRMHARRHGVSVASLFHAGWGLVVAATSGRSDVVFGSVLLGRLQGESGAQQILGMFINTLPLRLRLRDVTAQDLVEQAQRELVELLTYEQASLADAQRCSGVKGSAPLFSSLLNFRHSVANPDADLNRVSGFSMLAEEDRTNYPVTMSVDDLGVGFVLSALTDRRINPQRMTAYFHEAMQSLVAALRTSPQKLALTLSVLPPSERHRVIESFNATEVAYLQEKLVHELFEDQVERTPSAVALIFGGNSLTYSELNARANQLARFLRSKGVGPKRPVAVCMDRSIEMVVALLGILKAGTAYLPLDPTHPVDRLQYMLEDAAPLVVLTQEKLRPMLPRVQVEFIALDAEQNAVSQQEAGNLSALETGLTRTSSVYVIYTSGSTGHPKGTEMPHSAMVNLIEWHRHGFGASEGRRVLQFAALSFDVAFQEIFSTLCTGGTLVLLAESARRDIAALTQLIGTHSIERLFVPPLILQSLAEHVSALDSTPEHLIDVITAGEQLRITPEISRFFERLPRCRLHNHYGPTETHVVTALTLAGEPAAWPLLPTIGRPISNTRIYILDEGNQPVPVGVSGEIYIAGAGVARGYPKRPDLTMLRFLPDPFGAGRMYRTGDVGRWQEDGAIEYLGRNDDQVKIRGFRVELGEIEAQLEKHVQVREAVVIAREDVPGEKQLVAYVTSRDSQNNPGIEGLRAHLAESLPDHMVPTAFVILERLPTTATGKLDRRSLPAPETSAYLSREYEAPSGDVEERLAHIWRTLLRRERVGRNDNFFELGGHSLLAMQAIVRIRAALSIEVPIRLLFEAPTLHQLAAQVDDLRRMRLLDEISAGGRDIDELLERVASMPDYEIQALVTELRSE